MSNLTNINNCTFPDIFRLLVSNANFVRMYIILPVYAIAGLFGHTLFLIAISKEAKKDRVFVYQQYVVIGEIIEIFSWILYVPNRSWSGLIKGTPALKWCTTIYICMAYSAYMGIWFIRTSGTVCLLLSCSQAADRAFLLISPATHHTINKKKHQLVALFVSVFIAVTTNGYLWFTYHISFDINQQEYHINGNNNFLTSLILIAWLYSSNVIKLIASLILVICNVNIVFRYHRRFGNKVNVAVTTSDPENRKTDQRKLAEKTVILLTLCESCFYIVVIISEMLPVIATFTVPNYSTCYTYLFGPIVDTVTMLSPTLNFYAALAFCKQFRNMVKNVLICKK